MLRLLAAAIRILFGAALFAALSPSPAVAQVGVVGDPLSLCVVRAAPGMSARQLFAASSKTFDCVTDQRKFGPGDYWVITKPLTALDSTWKPFRIRTASLWQKRATLFTRYTDGTVTATAADDRATARAIQLGAIVEQRTEPRAAPLDRLLWHVEGSANPRGIVAGARIATAADSARSNAILAALYAGFVGLCIGLLTHNFALWRAMRQPFQLAYLGMAAMLMCYAVSSSGALAWLFPDLPNTGRMRVNYLTLGGSGACALLFARTFFERRIFTGWLDRVSIATTGGLLLSAILYAAAAPWQMKTLDLLFSSAFFALLACIVPMLWRAWRLRSDFRWLFAVAWGAPIALTAARLINNLAPLPWSFWLDNSTLIAMTSEALLSSMAIAYRVRLIARERDEARVEEIAARVLADTDPLTGLLNRRAFLRTAIGRPGSQVLLVADLDRFKQINETIGHDGGDEVLRIFARTLRSVAPADALVARLGGEEFALLCSRATAPEPESVLARLRAARMPYDLTVTASIGGSNGTLANDAEWKALYKAADRALFDAKEAGRDRSRLAKGGWSIAA